MNNYFNPLPIQLQLLVDFQFIEYIKDEDKTFLVGHHSNNVDMYENPVTGIQIIWSTYLQLSIVTPLFKWLPSCLLFRHIGLHALHPSRTNVYPCYKYTFKLFKQNKNICDLIVHSSSVFFY